MPDGAVDVAQPDYKIKPNEIQAFGTLKDLPIALEANARAKSVGALNQLLVDTITIRDMYKKHHWQVSGVTFYQIHLLFDKHFEEQSAFVDDIAERIQSLGGLAYAMAADVAENTKIPRPPKGREDVPTQISRLLEAHEIMLRECREYASEATSYGDDGTNDLIVSSLIRTHEMQVWFLAEHLAATPLLAKDR
ncbi:Dps family protein [Caulobacter sp. S45]|jgi:starvation-inducible DNA-binding protein|uniref:Dps family protein n=1 Tax=Caulobacter sp. S45 TaxID=1641861 RepID=UPI00131A935D|nr:DNA starvation/stationary phase protection protein [Caulobacter sp. S45]